jgi:hypothetical protein
MSFWKVINIVASCVLGIVVFRISSRKAKEKRLFEKKETEA